MFNFPTKITLESFRIFYDTWIPETHHVFKMMNFNLEMARTPPPPKKKGFLVLDPNGRTVFQSISKEKKSSLFKKPGTYFRPKRRWLISGDSGLEFKHIITWRVLNKS